MTAIVRQARIRGRVQGVSYRYWTEREALRRGLAGWVRNRRDGDVEALFSGPEAQVLSMLSALESGPPAARVTEVVVSEPGEPESWATFEIRPTV